MPDKILDPLVLTPSSGGMCTTQRQGTPEGRATTYSLLAMRAEGPRGCVSEARDLRSPQNKHYEPQVSVLLMPWEHVSPANHTSADAQS